MTRKPLAAAFALLIYACPTCSNGVNLLPNGDFATQAGVDGWYIPFSPAPMGWMFEWSGDDAQASVASGSLQLDPVPDNMVWVQSSCFRVSPGAAYAFGGEGRKTSGAAATWLTCTVFTDSKCAGVSADWGSTQLGAGSTWAVAFSASGILQMTTHSVRCRLLADNSGNISAAKVQVDNLYFDSSDALFDNGFESPGGMP